MENFIFDCILLVDDDDITNMYNKYMLKDAGFSDNINVALNGREGLDYLLNQGKFKKNDTGFPQPDLILLDINMPIMNGFEFLEEYEKLPDNVKGKIMICMLTTSLHGRDVEKAGTHESIFEFINKPLDPEVLKQIIAKHNI